MGRDLPLAGLLLFAALVGGCERSPAPARHPTPTLPTQEQVRSLKPAPPPWELKGGLPAGVSLPKDARTKKLPRIEDLDLSALDRIPPPPPPPPVQALGERGKNPARRP